MAVVLVRNLRTFSGDPGDEIASRVAAGRTESFFSVAPTKRKVRRLLRDYLAAAPSGVAGPFAVFTLGTLAESLHDALLPQRTRLTDRMRAAVVQEAIRTCADGLGYFTLRGPQRRLPRGTLARIANVINRLKSTGVYLTMLREEIGEGAPGERLKLRDIALIYETYERLLGEGGYIDSPGFVEAVNLEWTKPGSDLRFRERHPSVDFVAVSGFDEFSDPELTMLGYLSGVPGLGTVVTFDYHPDNEDLFGHLRENYRKLLEMGFRAAGPPSSGMTPFQAHIARHLFAAPEGKSAGSARRAAKGGKGRKPVRPASEAGAAEPATFDATSIITECPAPDRVREAELVAKIVRTEIADTPGLGPADICVCSPRPEYYSAIFREVFEQAGIPANVTDRFLLEESSAVTGLVSMLLVAQNNFRIGDIARAGTNPFLRIPTGAGEFDASNLLRVAGDIRTVSGRKRWIERIESRSRFLRHARPGGADALSRAEAAEEERLQRARRDIDALDRLLETFRAPMKPVEFRDAVVRLAHALGVPASLAAAGSFAATVADVERESRAFAEFLGFLEEFPAIVSIESPAGEAHPLSWYLERFRPLLSQARYNVKQRHGEGVLVTSIDEVRGLSFRVMIVAGLIDGEFPAVYEPEVFLTPKSRERRERYHLHEQRYLFYQALSGCSGRIYLTRPLRENDVELNPSGFLERLAEAASITRYRPGDAPPFADTIVTADELLSDRVERGDPSVPDRIRTAITAEEARRRDTGAGPWRGILDPAELGEREAARLAAFATGTYSVKTLETYGDCPYKFFADRVLGLRVPEEPDEGLTPREMGGLVHEVLYDFYSGRRDRGLPPIASLDDAGFAEAAASLRELAARRFDEAHVDDVFWEIGREAMLGGPGGPGVLEEMLASERSSGVSALPSWFEVRFGRAGEDLRHCDPEMYSDDPVPAGRIFLQGKIDRIDADGDAFAVVDYKTGKSVPEKKDVDEGASLQLPLYLHCAESIINSSLSRLSGPGSAEGQERIERRSTGGAGIYYRLGGEKFESVARVGDAGMKGRLIRPSSRTSIDADADALRSRIAGAVAAAGERAERISRGLFPVEPREPAVCRRCGYHRMCRIRTRLSPDAGREEGEGRGNDDQQLQDA